MIDKRIKQALIYPEGEYWTWQIIDVSGREFFSETPYIFREDAVESMLDNLRSVIKSLKSSEN